MTKAFSTKDGLRCGACVTFMTEAFPFCFLSP